MPSTRVIRTTREPLLVKGTAVMPISPENRARLLDATREAAAAFLEDMRYIRGIVEQNSRDRRELRHLSALLRRILIDNNGDIRSIAPPRTGKIVLTAPDNSLFYPIDRATPFTAFFSGGPKMMGLEYRGLVMHSFDVQPRGYDPERTIQLSQDGFLSQRVLSLRGDWATRSDVIKFSANIASGVHSSKPSEKVEILLDRIRRLITYTPDGGGVKMAFDLAQVTSHVSNFRHVPQGFDAVLLELFATAYYLLSSPDIDRLQAAIEAELQGYA